MCYQQNTGKKAPLIKFVELKNIFKQYKKINTETMTFLHNFMNLKQLHEPEYNLDVSDVMILISTI